MQSAIDSGKKQILFQRGGTYYLGGSLNLQGKKDIFFGATGSGATPVLEATFDGTTANGTVLSIVNQNLYTRNITFENLKIQTSYSGYSDRARFLSSNDTNGNKVPSPGSNITIRNCVFDHLNAVYEESTDGGAGFLFQNSSTVDTQSLTRYFYSAFGGTTMHSGTVLLGNTVHNSRDESAVRVGQGEYVLLYDNSLSNPTLSGEPGGKSSLRLSAGQYMWAAKNYLDAEEVWAGPLIGPDGQKNDLSRNATGRYIVYENNEIDAARFEINHGLRDSVIRNNVLTGGAYFIIQQNQTDATYPSTRIVSNVAIVNNTRIASSSSSQPLLLVDKPSSWDGVIRYDDLTFANNLQVGSTTNTVWLRVGDQSRFDLIENNVWPSANLSSTPYRINDVAKTLSEWNAGISGTVNDDISITDADSHSYVSSTTFRPSTTAANTANVVANARQDFYGDLRSGSGVTAGAAEAFGGSSSGGTVRGFYFSDLDGNGVQDSGDAAQDNKEFYLDEDADGVLDAGEVTASTDSNGNFIFENVDPGTYRVRRNLPSGFRFSTPTAGYFEVTVSNGSDTGGLVFGYTTTSTIGGYFFMDDDGDGVFDSGESGLSGRTMYIDANTNNAYDTGEATAQSDSTGYFQFTGLNSGTYRIRHDGLESGYSLTTPSAGYQSITVGTAVLNTTAIFGIEEDAPPTVGSISGIYFGDNDGNGVMDVGESGQSGKRIYIDTDNDGVRDAGESYFDTLSDGSYSFSNLTPGTYIVRRDGLPAGYRFSTPVDQYFEIALTAGEDSTGNNFGTTSKSTIGGYFFMDDDGDGVFDSGESGLSGRTMYIDANTNNAYDTGEATAQSDSTGYFQFTGLNSGTYRIRHDGLESGYSLTTPSAGYQSITVGTAVLNTTAIFGIEEDAPPTVGSISGIYFGDNDGNGVMDVGESGQSGKRIYIDTDNDGVRDAGESYFDTLSDGSYSFSNLTPGTYIVRRDGLPAGYRFSTPVDQYFEIALTAGEDSTGNNFGTTSKSTIGGYFFMDDDGDGVFDSGESGLSGRTMYIDANTNNAYDTGEATAQSDSTGYFQFTGLNSGTYRIRHDGLESGYSLTTPLGRVSVDHCRNGCAEHNGDIWNRRSFGGPY
ncbi:MAG: hypothetical protein KatS3mg104_0164 [Phycisphaerae bacterium]|nr:MAG: hypothetical protein KatS3mg104_0164 [Phycisphaerae bacterium]